MVGSAHEDPAEDLVPGPGAAGNHRGPSDLVGAQLIGLPDVGDPFDVAAFRAFTIPDDRNAFVLYRRAATLLKFECGVSEETKRQGRLACSLVGD